MKLEQCITLEDPNSGHNDTLLSVYLTCIIFNKIGTSTVFLVTLSGMGLCEVFFFIIITGTGMKMLPTQNVS